MFLFRSAPGAVCTTCGSSGAAVFCPSYMRYGCVGADELTACHACVGNSVRSEFGEYCDCAAGEVNLDGSEDGSGCVPLAYLRR